MKFSTVVVSVSIFFLSSCHKETESESSHPSTDSFESGLSATVAGARIQADSVKARLFVDTTIFPFPWRFLIIDGYYDHGTKVIETGFNDTSLSIFPEVKSYDSLMALNGGSLCGYYLLTDSAKEFLPVNAHFSITYSDTVHQKISGSFDGLLIESQTQDSITILNGRFDNVSYILE